MKFKIPFEMWLMIFMIVGPLTLVQALHNQAHSDYCKTESECKEIQRTGGS